MQIQLKQAEIVEALKGYITAKGINLASKTVDISFTAGRRDAGLSADIDIGDSYAEASGVVAEAPKAAPVAAPATDPVPVPEVAAAPVPEVPAVPVKTLFGA